MGIKRRRTVWRSNCLRLSVAGKGLFLVAVPLIFELVFVGGLALSLKNSEQQIDKQLRSQALVEQATILMRELVSASFEICFEHISSQTPRPPSETKAGVLDTITHLEGVVAGDPSLLQSSREIRRSVDTFYDLIEHLHEMSPTELLSGSSLPQTLSEMRRVMQLIDRSVRKYRFIANRSNDIDLDEPPPDWKRLLLPGLLLSFVLTVVLALSFAKSISLRLRKLAENTRRVSRGLPPLPPLGGSDEVSDLDLVIQKMAAQLSFAEKQRSQLSSMMKNRLADPLTDARSVLLGLAENNVLTAPAKNAVRKSTQGLDRLVNLLDDLTALDQIESGKIELHKKDLNSTDLVLRANESVQSLAAKKQISLLQAGENQRFIGDGERITQVLINLLSNAIKFSPENASISVSVAASNTDLEFRVKDQGPGIPKELQSKIFERYEQTHREDATAKGGAGLGLSICAVIASSHGGSLGVDSEPGQGSEFWLRLPVSGEAGAEERKSASLPSPQNAAKKSATAVASAAASSAGVSAAESKPLPARKPAFKIWQKGLVVVAVPLLFQICFVLVLDKLLDKAQRQTENELHAKKITTTVNEMYRVVINLSATAGGIYVSGGMVETAAHSREIGNLLAAFEQLFELEKNDPVGRQLACAVFESSERILLTTSKLMLEPPPSKTIGALALIKRRIANIEKAQNVFGEHLSRLLRKQERIEADYPALREATRIQIWNSIIGALLLSVLMSLLLGLFFSKSISKRLSVLIENTLRFTEGKDELLPELKGNDELSEFDQDFRHMLSRIRENQEFKKQLLSVVSHELRTPLTSISGSILLLHDGAYGELPATESQEVLRAQQDILLVIQLVNDLLDIERLEAAKFPMEIKEVELMKTLQAAVALSNKQMPDIVFNVDSKLSDSPLVTCDEDLLAKAISKLMVFCAAGEQKGSSLTVNLERENSALVLRVNDNANWLIKGDTNIFDKFQLLEKLERENAQDKMSVALALALAKVILDQMGLQLTAQPAHDDNSRGSFQIRF